MSKLKDRRVAKKLSQSALGEKSGVNIPMIQKYEQGVKDINRAQVLTVYQLALALGCAVEDLIEI